MIYIYIYLVFTLLFTTGQPPKLGFRLFIRPTIVGFYDTLPVLSVYRSDRCALVGEAKTSPNVSVLAPHSLSISVWWRRQCYGIVQIKEKVLGLIKKKKKENIRNLKTLRFPRLPNATYIIVFTQYRSTVGNRSQFF